MEDTPTKNSIAIAILQTQFGDIKNDISEIKDNQKNHEEKDAKRHEAILAKLDLNHEDSDLIRQMIADIKRDQAVERVKLGIIVGGVVLIAKELLLTLASKIF